MIVTSAVRMRVRLPSLCEGERGFAFLQQRRDGGVPSTQGGDDAHGKNELMGHAFILSAAVVGSLQSSTRYGVALGDVSPQHSGVNVWLD